MATIFTGTNGDDDITSGADIIYALDGQDTVHATNPVGVSVFGGRGDDVIFYEYGDVPDAGGVSLSTARTGRTGCRAGGGPTCCTEAWGSTP
jgi:hypothetical protein